MSFATIARVGVAVSTALLVAACHTPDPVREQARVTALDVGLFRDQLQANVKAANTAITSRRARATNALKQDKELDRATLLTQMIAVETDRRRKAAFEKMSSVSERQLASERKRIEEIREGSKRFAASAPLNAATFAELPKAQAALNDLAEETREEVLRGLFQYAKATAAAMKEQAEAMKAKDKSEKAKP